MEELETVLLSVVIVFQILIIILLQKERAHFYRDVKMLYGSIATDLNAITSTIAVYTGTAQQSLIVPPGGSPGEGLPVDPVEAARRKAELWRALRARGGGRK